MYFVYDSKDSKNIFVLICFILAFFLFFFIFEFSEFQRGKEDSSHNVVSLINKQIDEKQKKLRTFSVLLKEIYIDIGDDELFLDFSLKSIIHGESLDVSEVSIYERGLYKYVNEYERGIFKSEVSRASEFDKIKDMGGYFLSSESYVSKTTGLESLFIMFYITEEKVIFIEFSIDSLFYYLDTHGDYVFIINDVSNNLIYHPDQRRIGTQSNSLDVSLYNENKHWLDYSYQGKPKKAHISKSNPFGWYVVYSMWSVEFYRVIVVKLFLFFCFVLIPSALFFYRFFKESNKKVEIDVMTGLLKRDSFKANKLDRRVKALCFLDIDHFKSINDTYGHDIGDEAIKAFANCLKENIRDTDVAFRWGGEEFLVIIRGKVDENIDVYNILERLRASVEAMDIDGVPQFTVSMGYCHYDSNVDVKELIKQADLALYESKRTGRNKVSEYKSRMSDEPITA